MKRARLMLVGFYLAFLLLGVIADEPSAAQASIISTAPTTTKAPSTTTPITETTSTTPPITEASPTTPPITETTSTTPPITEASPTTPPITETTSTTPPITETTSTTPPITEASPTTAPTTAANVTSPTNSSNITSITPTQNVDVGLDTTPKDPVDAARYLIKLISQKVTDFQCPITKTCPEPTIDEKSRQKSDICSKMKKYASCVEEYCKTYKSLVTLAQEAEHYSLCDGAMTKEGSYLLLIVMSIICLLFSK